MNYKRLWVSATIIALIVVIGFVITVPHTRDIPAAITTNTASSSVPAVTLHDVYKKGVHTITGALLAPNACSIVSADAALEGDSSTSQSILIHVSVPTDGGICLQLPTRETFQTIVSAPSGLPFNIFVNGAVASTTVQ